MAKKKTASVCRRNSQRLNKTCCRTWKTDTSLKQTRSAATGFAAGLKDNEEIRPLSANRNTIKAMEQRGLISPGKGRDPLTRVAAEKKIKKMLGGLRNRLARTNQRT